MGLYSGGGGEIDNKQNKEVKYILYSINPTMNIFSHFKKHESGRHLLVDGFLQPGKGFGVFFFFLE